MNAQTAARALWQRSWWSLTAVAVIIVGLGLRPGFAQVCVGDCKGEGTVDITDLIIGVDIALGLQPVTACGAFANQDDKVDIAQLIQGVNNALNGCPASPTPTDTIGMPTVTATAPTTSTATPIHTPILASTATATSTLAATNTATTNTPGTTATATSTGTLPSTATVTDTPSLVATSTSTQTPASTSSVTVTATPTVTPTQPDRFVDNGDGTITDNQTGLIWEKKDQGGGLHDVHILYVWAGFCSDGTGDCQPDPASSTTCNAATGGAIGCAQCPGTATCNNFYGVPTIWEWLNQLNATSFAGHSDWHIPTVGQNGGTAQLETILDPSVAPGCSGDGELSRAPCVPPAFNTGCTVGCTVTSCSCTDGEIRGDYWSATTDAALDLGPFLAWYVNFSNGNLDIADKDANCDVRAVRGGL